MQPDRRIKSQIAAAASALVRANATRARETYALNQRTNNLLDEGTTKIVSRHETRVNDILSPFNLQTRSAILAMTEALEAGIESDDEPARDTVTGLEIAEHETADTIPPVAMAEAAE